MNEDLVLALFAVLPVLWGVGLFLLTRRKRATQAKASVVQLIAGNVLVLLLLLSLFLLGGEIYYRFFYDTTDALGFTKVSQRWYQRHWHANTSDCRDSINYSLSLKPGERRITFIGDSFTAGHGIDDVEQRFANLIRARHPEWQIQVLAQPGFDTGNEVKFLGDSVAQGYKLGTVVLVYCLNDVADMFPQWVEAVTRIRAKADDANWLVKNSYFVNTWYYRMRIRFSSDAESYFTYVKQGYEGADWDRQKQRLTSLRDLVEANGGRLLVVTFPFMHALGGKYEYQPAHDQLNAFWKELNVPHLDLLNIYRDLPASKVTVNRFDGHPNVYANALAADAIAQFIAQQSGEKGPSK